MLILKLIQRIEAALRHAGLLPANTVWKVLAVTGIGCVAGWLPFLTVFVICAAIDAAIPTAHPGIAVYGRKVLLFGSVTAGFVFVVTVVKASVVGCSVGVWRWGKCIANRVWSKQSINERTRTVKNIGRQEDDGRN